jgi:hypothetical protein
MSRGVAALALCSLLWASCRTDGARTKADAAGPTVRAPAFEVEVRLSDHAMTKLAKIGETVTVAAYFFGLPRAEARHLGGEMGELHVGYERRELRTSGVVRFDGSPLDATRVSLLEGGRVKVLINVVSSRKASENNLLDCGVYEDSIERAAREGIRLHCREIGERPRSP